MFSKQKADLEGLWWGAAEHIAVRGLCTKECTRLARALICLLPPAPMLPVPSFQDGENRHCLSFLSHFTEKFSQKNYFQTSQLLRTAQAAQSSPCFSCHGSQVGFTRPSILLISLIPSYSLRPLCAKACASPRHRENETLLSPRRAW